MHEGIQCLARFLSQCPLLRAVTSDRSRSDSHCYLLGSHGTSWTCSMQSELTMLSCKLLRPVLLAGRDGEQRRFGGRRDLVYSTPRVRWLRTPLRGKTEAQGSRLSKPEKKGTRPIGNSRGIAVRVGRLLSGSGKALDTFLCPLHESGLVEGKGM